MPWRLIPLLNASGQLQMAIDQWLLEQHRVGSHPPIVRFYTWASPTISLGYHQRRWPESWQQLIWQGIPLDLVRRPTGGRAVLHQGDLTYMVVTSGLNGKRLDGYREICEFLIQGWRSLGVDLYYGSAGREYRHNPNCFGTATGADLVTAQGYKFIGSAQLRRGKAILQHGSIRLQPDAELFTQVFGEGESITVVSPHPKSISHGERDFEDLLPSEVMPPDEVLLQPRGDCLIPPVMDALTRAVADCFGVELIEQPLSDEEWQAILAQPSLEVGSPVRFRSP